MTKLLTNRGLKKNKILSVYVKDKSCKSPEGQQLY